LGWPYPMAGRSRPRPGARRRAVDTGPAPVARRPAAASPGQARDGGVRRRSRVTVSPASRLGLFHGYPSPGCFDELIGPDGSPYPAFRRCVGMLGALSPDEFARAHTLAEVSLLNQGVTFSVYKDPSGTEKIFPFCLIPRIISARDWAYVERG